eukprot:s227_g5.t1
MAMQAGHPSNRSQSLAELESDVLAKTTAPAVQSRLRTFRALAAVWELPPFPITVEVIKAVSASFKKGGYRSAHLYFQAAVQHQIRVMGEPVSALVHACIRDMCRSIRRGLGPSRLKDVFPLAALEQIPPGPSEEPFDLSNLTHFKDVMLISSWFMLRELELAAACASHLSLSGDLVTLLVPTHKTETAGNSTYRALRCVCRVRQIDLCPWHASERHLVRLQHRSDIHAPQQFPLCPTASGQVPSKHLLVAQIRKVLQQSGVATTREDGHGNTAERFSGHCCRVAGAQFLISAGISQSMVQLLGRWSSSAIERYTQTAGLQLAPDISVHAAASQNLSQRSIDGHEGHTVQTKRQRVSHPMETSSSISELKTAHDSLSRLVDKIGSDMETLRTAILPVQQTFVVRGRSKVAHIIAIPEAHNNPQDWRTKCGWQYGVSRFFRIADISEPFRPCKKCHNLEESSSSDSDVAEQVESGSSSDSSSSEHD